MSQAGYTPIQLYFSTTAAAVPVNTNLANGELAINITDGKLYYKDNGGTVRLLASNATSAPVLSFSAGTTGFTPSTATTGAITLAGTLATTNGGTGLTSFTSGGVVYASSSSALATSSSLTFDGTILKIYGAANEMLRLDTVSTATDAAIRLYQAGVQKANIQAGVGATGGGLDIYSSGSTSIVFGNSSELMRLTSTGLGIGTSSPAGKLHVVGAQNAWSQVIAGNTTSAQSYGMRIQAGTTSADTSLLIRDATNTADYLTVIGNGNVGIGTSSPAKKLDVYLGTTGTVEQYLRNTTINLLSKIDGTTSAQFGTETSHPLIFLTSNTEKARIDSSGTFSIKNDYQEQTYTANSSTAITLNIVTNGTDQVITLTGTATITMPTATAGKSFLLKLKTGAGGYTVTWSTVKWPSGTAPTLTSTASRMDIFSFFADGTNWYGTTVGQNYTP